MKDCKEKEIKLLDKLTAKQIEALSELTAKQIEYICHLAENLFRKAVN